MKASRPMLYGSNLNKHNRMDMFSDIKGASKTAESCISKYTHSHMTAYIVLCTNNIAGQSSFVFLVSLIFKEP